MGACDFVTRRLGAFGGTLGPISPVRSNPGPPGTRSATQAPSRAPPIEPHRMAPGGSTLYLLFAPFIDRRMVRRPIFVARSYLTQQHVPVRATDAVHHVLQATRHPFIYVLLFLRADLLASARCARPPVNGANMLLQAGWDQGLLLRTTGTGCAIV